MNCRITQKITVKNQVKRGKGKIAFSHESEGFFETANEWGRRCKSNQNPPGQNLPRGILIKLTSMEMDDREI